MDDEEDTRSHNSPRSEPNSPPSGQITVTVAAAPPTAATPPSCTPPPSLPPSSLTLALPIQQFPRPLAIVGSGGGGGREDCWSEGATSVLIDAWGERYMELSRGNLKQKHWKEVADIVSSREDYTKVPKTDIQCKNRIDTVKKKYKIEKQKVLSGCGPSRWPFFERLDRLIGPAATPTTSKGGAGLGPLSTATVSTCGSPSHGRAVPVGIPVGVRPLPLPFSNHYLQTPPHLQSQQQQLQQQQRMLQQTHQRLQHTQQRLQQPQHQQLRQNLQFSPVSQPRNNSINSPPVMLERMNKLPQQQFKRVPPPADSDSDQEEWSQDSADSLPPVRTGFERRKRRRMEVKRGGERRKGEVNGREKKAAVKAWGSSVRDLTKAIMKFGEAYEAAESAKLKHVVEMEVQRMKFAKEMELQRMKFMMKTKLDLSQLNGNGSNNSDSRGGGSGGGVGGGETNHNRLLHENHMNHADSDSSN